MFVHGSRSQLLRVAIVIGVLTVAGVILIAVGLNRFNNKAVS